jgi:hypothetical protein
LAKRAASLHAFFVTKLGVVEDGEELEVLDLAAAEGRVQIDRGEGFYGEQELTLFDVEVAVKALKPRDGVGAIHIELPGRATIGVELGELHDRILPHECSGLTERAQQRLAMLRVSWTGKRSPADQGALFVGWPSRTARCNESLRAWSG